jgi:hypothetical protein
MNVRIDFLEHFLVENAGATEEECFLFLLIVSK